MRTNLITTAPSADRAQRPAIRPENRLGSAPLTPPRETKPRKTKTKPKRRPVSAEEALTKAVSGPSLANYPAIYAGFAAKGIPEVDIKPRENVFTFKAWIALGRCVKKGEHGVKIATIRGGRKTEKVDPESGDVKVEIEGGVPWTRQRVERRVKTGDVVLVHHVPRRVGDQDQSCPAADASPDESARRDEAVGGGSRWVEEGLLAELRADARAAG